MVLPRKWIGIPGPSSKAKCVHGKFPSKCYECGTYSKRKDTCVHGKRRYRCVPCGGKQEIEKKCPHGYRKDRCVEVGGCGGKPQHQKCPHGKHRRTACKLCGGNYVCIVDGCDTITMRAKTKCKTCCPSPKSTSPCKELQLASSLTKWTANRKLPLFTAWGRQNPEAYPPQCGAYRPDFVWELENEQRVVILECDENAHRPYPVRCEFTRPINMAIGYGERPVHLVRFNPDPLPRVKKMPEKKERKSVLLSTMQAALASAPSDDSRFKNILTIEFLYYYDIPGSTLIAPHVQTITFPRAAEYEAWAETTIVKFEGETHRSVDMALESERCLAQGRALQRRANKL